MYYVYILKSLKDGSYYIGHTGNLEKRLSKHNSKGSIFTKGKTPYKIVLYESLNTRGEAMRREMEVKSYKGGQAFKRLVGRLE
ncbi:MAG: GIY-YIG nuclease family protein [Candidatus Colwellbacteria bacterium]|nr:GIY-YIG nuclease family protein [Candidatus Colwellbacteria bacterium]